MSTPGELVHVQLAQQDRAGAPEALGDGGVVIRDPVLQHLAAGRGPRSAHGHVVLQTHRHTVQRTEVVAGAEHRIRGTRNTARLVREDGDVGREAVIHGVDAREARLDEFER